MAETQDWASNTAYVDRLNFGLVFLAAIVGHIFPIDLLVLVYAILGPLHYLTELSWLHDRKYFFKNRFDYLPLVAIVLFIFLVDDLGQDYIALVAAFAIAIGFTTVKTWPKRLLMSAGLTVLGVVLLTETPAIWFFVMLPNMVHILLFTFIFVLFGALHNQSTFGYATLGAIVLCGASFFVLAPIGPAPSAYGADNLVFITPIFDAFFELLGVPQTSLPPNSLVGFVGFALTYHYLNWFSKVGIIGWHRVSKPRAGIIGILYIASVALYFYDYALGVKILLLLSFGHVILEFPLNVITIKRTSRMLFSQIVPKVN